MNKIQTIKVDDITYYWDYVVKCLNVHDELVEALAEAKNYIKGDYTDEDGIVERLENALKQVGA